MNKQIAKHFLYGLVVLSLVFFVMPAHAQQQDSLSTDINQSRNKQIKHILDYRFKGGAGAFESELLKHVSYTPEALNNCVIGTVILSFTVDCDNKIGDLRMRNPLHFGLNEKLQAFFKATEGQWNTCKDDRYTKFEIPVLFTIGKTETSAKGFVIIEGESPGLRCKSDAYYMEQFEKWRNKGKVKRAIESLDMLIRRDPYNQSYFDLKKELLTSSEKD